MSPVPREVIDADIRKVIAMARELAAITGPGDLAAHTGSDPADIIGAYAAAFGEAKVLLRSLAVIAERLSGGEAVKLLEAALFLRVNGERPPGAPRDDPEAETWPAWDREAEAFLHRARGMMGP